MAANWRPCLNDVERVDSRLFATPPHLPIILVPDVFLFVGCSALSPRSSPLFLLNAESDLNAESLFVILSPENNRSERCSTRSNCLSSWIRVYEYLKFNLIRSSDSSHLAHVSREFYNKNYALWFERKLIINNIRLKSFNFNTRLVLIKILIIMV